MGSLIKVPDRAWPETQMMALSVNWQGPLRNLTGCACGPGGKAVWRVALPHEFAKLRSQLAVAFLRPPVRSQPDKNNLVFTKRGARAAGQLRTVWPCEKLS